MLRYFIYAIIILFVFDSCQKEDVKPKNQWNITDSEYEELLLLSDTSNLNDYKIFEERMKRIQDIFSSHNDPRGTFTTLYRHITTAAVNSTAAQNYNDNDFVDDFGVLFGKFYLINLKYHLLDQPTNYAWTIYYKECKEDANKSKLVILGMLCHISKDILDTLVQMRITESQEEDWVLISTYLMFGIEGFEEEFLSEYHIDLSDLINLYGFTEIIDGFFGEGATIYTILNELRYVAYKDALKYLAGLEQQMEYKTHQRFMEHVNLLEFIDDLNWLP